MKTTKTTEVKIESFLQFRSIVMPHLRRTAPVGIVHSGGKRTVFGCICGATHSCSTEWNGRNSKHVREFLAAHNKSCSPVGKTVEVAASREEIYSDDSH